VCKYCYNSKQSPLIERTPSPFICTEKDLEEKKVQNWNPFFIKDVEDSDEWALVRNIIKKIESF
jgi:hypothetical protein